MQWSGVSVSGNSLWFGSGGSGRAGLTILSLEDGFLRYHTCGGGGK